MQPDERDPAHLWDMREAARDAARILGNLDLEAFLSPNQETTRLAIERKLEILGEAARRLSDAFREGRPEVPWKDIIALRNVISHQYDKVDYAVIFGIVRKRIPGLLTLLGPLVPMPPAHED